MFLNNVYFFMFINNVRVLYFLKDECQHVKFLHSFINIRKQEIKKFPCKPQFLAGASIKHAN